MKIFLLGLSLFSLSGCTRYYYAANQHNVPAFQEKNEARLTGTYSLGDEVEGFEIQGAYSITKGFAVIGNACVFNPKSKDGKGHLYELGAGYYKPLAPEFPRVSGKLVFEAYGVAGLGAAKNFYCYPHYGAANFFKGYAQPSIGFASDYVDLIFSAKFGTAHFYNINRTFSDDTCVYDPTSSSYDDPPEELVQELRLLNDNSTPVFFEPAFTIRVGYKFIKLHYQWGGSRISNIQDLNSGFNMNVGILVSLSPRFRKKK